MFSTKCKKFKGEIENYLRNRQNQFESKIDRLFVSLRLKTWLRRTNIIRAHFKKVGLLIAQES